MKKVILKICQLAILASLVGGVWIIYAAWNDDVSTWDPLSADSWNNIVDRVEPISISSWDMTITWNNTIIEWDRDGAVSLRFNNPNTGTSAFTQFTSGVPGAWYWLYAIPTNYTTSGRFLAESVMLDTTASEWLGFSVANTTWKIRFYTWVNNERVVINENGNVGIGTQDPKRDLHIHDDWPSSVMITNDVSWQTTSDGFFLWLDGNGTTARVRNYEAWSIIFQTASNTDFTVLSQNGNFGIGLNSASVDVKLDVNGDIRMWNSGVSCDSSIEGSVRYDSTLKKHQGCDGSNWNNLY